MTSIQKHQKVWQYYKDDPNDNITQSEAFKSKIKKTGKSPVAGNTKDVKIVVPLKYLSNFWRTLEMHLINCEVELILIWFVGCVIIYTNTANQVSTFTITETNIYVPVVTLSTQDNAKIITAIKIRF